MLQNKLVNNVDSSKAEENNVVTYIFLLVWNCYVVRVGVLNYENSTTKKPKLV